ncbi:hypothetical protein LJB42_000828 [Komagataella kurtzmanii]|nr:hypothetical protein LJB42_000828 [Komagataella kurtzmanii]
MSQLPPLLPQTGSAPPPPVSQQNTNIGSTAKEGVRKRTQKQSKYRAPAQIDGSQFDHHFKAVTAQMDASIPSQPEFAEPTHKAVGLGFQNTDDTAMDNTSSYQSQNGPNTWTVGNSQTAEQVQSQYNSFHRSTYGASPHSLHRGGNDQSLQSQAYESDSFAWNPSSDHQNSWDNQQTQQELRKPSWEADINEGNYHQNDSTSAPQEPAVDSSFQQQPQHLQWDTQNAEDSWDQDTDIRYQPPAQEIRTERSGNNPNWDTDRLQSPAVNDDELPWDNEQFGSEELDDWDTHKGLQQEPEIGHHSQNPSHFNPQQSSDEQKLPWDKTEENVVQDPATNNHFQGQAQQNADNKASDQHPQQHKLDQHALHALEQEPYSNQPIVEEGSHQPVQNNAEQVPKFVEAGRFQDSTGKEHLQSEVPHYHPEQPNAWHIERNNSFAQSSPRQAPELQEAEPAWNTESNHEPDWLVSESVGQVFEIGHDEYPDKGTADAHQTAHSPFHKSSVFSEGESADFAELLKQEMTQTLDKPESVQNDRISNVQESTRLPENSFENKFSFLEDDDEILEADDVQPYQPQQYAHSITSEPVYRQYEDSVGQLAAPYSEYGGGTTYRQNQPPQPRDQSRMDYNLSADVSTQTVIRRPIRKSMPSDRYNPGGNNHAGLSTPVPDRTMIYPNILSPAQEFAGHPKLDALEQAKKKTDAYDFPPDMLKTRLQPSNKNLQTVSQNYTSAGYPPLRAASISTVGTDISFNNIDAQPPKRAVKKKQSFYSELPINNLTRNKPSVHAKDPYAEIESIAYHNRSRSSTVRSTNINHVPPPPVNPYAPVNKAQLQPPDVNPQTVPVPPPNNMFVPPPAITQHTGYASPSTHTQNQFAPPPNGLNPQPSRVTDVPPHSTTTNRYAPNVSSYAPQPAQQFAPPNSSNYAPSIGQQFNSSNAPVMLAQGIPQTMISQAGHPASDQPSVSQFGMQPLHLQTGVGSQVSPQIGLNPRSPNATFAASNNRGRRARSSVSTGMAPRVKSHNRKISALPPITQQTAPVVRNPEVYNRTQFPIFHWCRGGKALSMLPKFDTYGQSKVEINIVSNKDVIKIDPLIISFPGPLTKGKAKQKELIKWIEQKIASYNESSDVLSEQKSLLWKVLLYSVQKLDENPEVFNKNLVQLLDPQTQVSPDEPIDYNALTKSLETATHRRANASSLDPTELTYLYGLLQTGEKQRALSYSIFNRDWAMSLLLSSLIAPEQYASTVKLFLKYNFNEHDPVSKKLTFFLGLSNLADAEDLKHHSTFIIKNFESLLTFILNNKPNPENILLLIGNTLTEVGFFTYAQIVFAMSGVPLIPNESHVATRDIESIIFNEVYEWIIQNKPNSAFVNGIPQLVVMKAIHASILSDIGAVAEAEKYCNYALQSLKNTKTVISNQVLLHELQSLSLLLSEAGSSMNTWFGGLSKTNLDKVWGQLDKSFSKFVAGEHLAEDNKAGADVLTFNSSSNTAKVDQPQVHQQLPAFTTQGSSNYLAPSVYQPATMSTNTSPDYTAAHVSNGSGASHFDAVNNGHVDANNRSLPPQVGYGKEAVNRQPSQVPLANNYATSNTKASSRYADHSTTQNPSDPVSRGNPHMQYRAPSSISIDHPRNVSTVNMPTQGGYLPSNSMPNQQPNEGDVSELHSHAGSTIATPKISTPSLNGDSPHRLPLPPHIIAQMPNPGSSLNQINTLGQNPLGSGNDFKGSRSNSLQRTEENLNEQVPSNAFTNHGASSSAALPPSKNGPPLRLPLSNRSSRYAPVDAKGKVFHDTTSSAQKESINTAHQSPVSNPPNEKAVSSNFNPYDNSHEVISSETHQQLAQQQVQPPPVQQQQVQPPSVQQQQVQPPPVQQQQVQPPPVQQQQVQPPPVQQQQVQPPPVQQQQVQPPPVQQQQVQPPSVQQQQSQPPPAQQQQVQKVEQQENLSIQNPIVADLFQPEQVETHESHRDLGVSEPKNDTVELVGDKGQIATYNTDSHLRGTLQESSNEPVLEQQNTSPSTSSIQEQGHAQTVPDAATPVPGPQPDVADGSQLSAHVSEPIVAEALQSPTNETPPAQTDDAKITHERNSQDELGTDTAASHVSKDTERSLEYSKVKEDIVEVSVTQTEITQDSPSTQPQTENSTTVKSPPVVTQNVSAGKPTKARRTRRAASNRYAPNATHTSYLPAETSIDNEATSIQELMDEADANSFSYPGYSVPEAKQKPKEPVETKPEVEENLKTRTDTSEPSNQGDISVFKPAHTEDVAGIAPVRAIVEPEVKSQLDQNVIPAFRPPGENSGFSPLSIPTFDDNTSVKDDETFGDEVSDFDGEVSDSDDEDTKEASTRRRHSTNKSEQQQKETKTGKEDSGRWLGWLRSGSDNSKKVYRAKLGEKSTLRYDENLKRYIDTSKPLEEQLEATAPPPPPPSFKKNGNDPSASNINTTGTLPPSEPNESSKNEEQSSVQKALPPSGQQTAPSPVNPAENGTLKPNAGLDDIMAIASSRTAPRAKKRGPRSGYVDIMANSKK